MRKSIVGAVIAAAAIVPPVASAAHGAEPADFGHHVAQCARDEGFDGTHNPGMHQGRVGWDEMPC